MTWPRRNYKRGDVVWDAGFNRYCIILEVRDDKDPDDEDSIFYKVIYRILVGSSIETVYSTGLHHIAGAHLDPPSGTLTL